MRFELNGKLIWTIGHSTNAQNKFSGLLILNGIKTLADVRSLPGSAKFPQFNKENLQDYLPAHSIAYVHIPLLGGRRKVMKDSRNTGWRHPSFRGYADYMETEDFIRGINELISFAESGRTAFMCSEALWWRCHRSMISDYLKLSGWTVLHILSNGKTEEHPYTQPAKIKNGMLSYTSGTTDQQH